MGFRFNRRITIVPGVRLNISPSGLSASVGPRGLSMTLGRNGTYLNAGLPGTGLSYRQRLDGGRQSPAANSNASADYSGPIRISVQEDGTLSIVDDTGSPPPAAVVRRVKSEQAAEIEALLNKAAEKLNQDLADCLGVHVGTPRPGSLPALPPPFSMPIPTAPASVEPGLIDRLFRSGKLEADRLTNEQIYQQDLSEWEAARDAHDKERSEAEKTFRLAAKGFSAHMEKALDYVLSGIAWPKETNVAYQFTYDAAGIALDVDLPDEGDTPRRTAEAKGNGKLTFKTRSDAQVRRDFVGLCYGSLFRVVGEVFALLPAINRCLVSGYVQRNDPATGRLEEPYILSVVVRREDWDLLDFGRIEHIDPVGALNSWGARVDLERTARFREIQPFDLDYLG
ncbi:DUF4236 domain-containing protein (plasmid) [Pseudomonas fulva]|uniref:DUF4236 domain-containing protein n=2 Tax=Pseudomonas putida group TaxID=136845 RepID=A0A1X0ZR71_PSEPU|nr:MULTISPECIES: DUF4236 domain-containing protein [Pseudomonas]MCT8162694.1 DUF4236 domain-containing protein [Pseudomonas sp. HD6422]MCT8181537.1 DUF4236 domain-containing protein [Pseudomonas sp. HD6421]MDH1928871.1 DUF4236 domain-containing protein [Pseudomonas sp. GD03696]ORL52021.1 hypothetical protein B7H18_08270 [Pseudomonas putida]ORL61952.1 hypothetical protein B7H17_19775 [Pseudomonas putida]